MCAWCWVGDMAGVVFLSRSIAMRRRCAWWSSWETDTKACLKVRWVLSLGQLLRRAGAGVCEGAGAAVQADCALLKQLPLPGAPQAKRCVSGRKREQERGKTPEQRACLERYRSYLLGWLLHLACRSKTPARLRSSIYSIAAIAVTLE